jgi:hypothetical protein
LPVWEEAPRLSPARAFPSYRFTPGLNPHPRQNPKGHSYGHKEETPSYLPPERWRENDLYLYGIDLYHQGYLWESHEAWESLWHLTDKEGVEGQLLQGLIQNAAALLKVHLKQWDGARHLSKEAHRRLQFAAMHRTGLFMGLDLEAFLRDVEAFYLPLWEGNDAVRNEPPRLRVPFTQL